MTLTAHDIRKIAVAAHRDPRSVVSAYAGRAKHVVTISVQEAAEKLGYPPPPSPRSEEAHGEP
jgi:hypothetical protein